VLYNADNTTLGCASLAHDGSTAALRQSASIASNGSVAGTVTLEPVSAAGLRKSWEVGATQPPPLSLCSSLLQSLL
jgi:hypothetical protein